MIYIGTSGFSYDEWKGKFYPEKLPKTRYLSFYSECFCTTEINNTFYRIPSTKMVTNWIEKVPEDFHFTLKMNQKITHRKRLQGVEEEMSWFLRGTEPLGTRLKNVLVQLPPWFRINLEAIDEFLKTYSSKLPIVMGFRHESWDDQGLYDLLRKHQIPLVLAETDKKTANRELTGSWGYIRLRKSEYSKQEIIEWGEWLRSQEMDFYVYLKHSEKAPELAKTLQEAVQF